MRKMSWLLVALAAMSCASVKPTVLSRIPFQAEGGLEVARFEIPSSKETGVPLLQNIPGLGGWLPLGPGSALLFQGLDPEGRLLFLGATDRGPNADSPFLIVDGKSLPGKIFAAPHFIPSLVLMSLGEKDLRIEKVLPLQTLEGKPLTGLPLAPGGVGSSGEVALDSSLAALPFAAAPGQGLDTEGLARIPGDQEHLWVIDEYGPFLGRLKAVSGRLDLILGPGFASDGKIGLPDVLAKRIPNRGAEGLTGTPSGKLVFAIQSILDTEGNPKASKAAFTRIVEWDPVTRTSRMLGYPIDQVAYKRSQDAKIGDILALSDTEFLVIEQGKDKDGKMRNLIYKADFGSATDLSGWKSTDGKEAESLAGVEALSEAGIVLGRKTLLADLRALGWNVEKAEGLALVDDRTVAVASDNDFGLTFQVADPADGKDDPTAYAVSGGKMTLNGQEVSSKIALQPLDEKGQLWLLRFAGSLTAAR